uniref:Regulatory protein SIR2 homolog 7 n=1 Tax=Vannella robusta TaxID=1487602 RepID=A0A7S4I9G9_9EUKA|mmetsp:Transcript_22356/g.28559  ORF Transcript_22356/g.28559 Transcript_22356/m.28559 type:complete len:342 (+) Transcript_22356:7-1032(+)
MKCVMPISELADHIRSKRTVFYVGAGCSASAGVPTFNGKGAATSLLHVREDESDLVMPNFAHRAIKALIEEGYATHATTSNHDGLLHKTGLQDDKITEMFGSSYVEVCLSCSKKFRRKTATPPLNRKCEECGGRLNKKGCRYGQSIEPEKLNRGQEEAENSDIAICLGSGMHTWPFTLNGMCGKAPMRVVVNLGRTSADGFPGVTKYDLECDEFMQLLCEQLNVSIPPITYTQEFKVFWKWTDDSKTTVSVGLRPGVANNAVTFAQDEVQLNLGDRSLIMERNPMRWTFETTCTANDGNTISFTILPREEYGHPDPIVLQLEISSSVAEREHCATFRIIIN